MRFDSFPRFISIVGAICFMHSAYAGCPFGKGRCASLTDSTSGIVLGQSYVRCDAGYPLGVREIFGGGHFETDSNVRMDITPSGGAASCPAPANPLPPEVDMKIEDKRGGNFELTLFKQGTDVVVTSVNLHTMPKLGNAVHWLQGSAGNGNDADDYFVYLRDEPTASNQIVKRYRIERFETGCKGEEPVEGKTFRPLSIGFKCPVSKVNSIAFQTNSGDGYEPRR